MKKILLFFFFLLMSAGYAFGADATMTAVTAASSVTVNSKAALKCGTTSSAGAMKITVPAGATSISFYMGAWKNESPIISVTPAAKVGTTSFTPTSDNNFTGSSSSFTTNSSESTYLRTITLNNITTSTDITFTSNGSKKRFIIWGATYETGSTPSYTITAQSNNNSYGTVSLDGATITATPNSGYRVSTSNPYSISPANSATISQNGNTFTVTPTANTTVTINFEATPTYTVSYNTNGGTGTMSDGTGESVTIADCSFTAPECKTFERWNTAVEGNGTNYSIGSTVTEDLTLYAIWADIPTYTVSFNTGGIPQSTCSGSITLPSTPISGCESDGWEFAGWSESDNNFSNLIVTNTYTPTQDITLYAVFSKGGSGAEYVTDTLTHDFIGTAGTSYVNFNNKTQTSDAVYAGNSAGGNTSIQLRSGTSNNSTQHSGIISSESGGSLYSIKLKWNDNNAVDRTVLIYTSDTVIESVNDMYGYSRAKDSISYGDENLLLLQNKPYIGIRSKSGALYLDTIFITWSSSSVEYSLSPVCGDVALDTIYFNEDTIRLKEGQTQELRVQYRPNNTTNKIVSWASLNTGVATIDSTGVGTGLITAMAKGETVVFAMSEEGEKVAACVVSVYAEPSMSVVEWATDYVKIDIENFTPESAILEDQNIQADVQENLATELFFSKYFEAEGYIKLLGLYNGTKNSISLTDYVIKVAQGTKVTTWGGTSGEFVYDLSSLSSIEPSQEIILISYTNSDTTIINCILGKNSEGLKYQKVGSGELVHGTKGNLLQFSGDDAIGLFKNGDLIDIIGAGTASAANVDSVTTNKTGTYLGHYHDDFCWVAVNNVDTLSTNLCLLIRKNSVHSGEDAVASNTLDFVTLSTEWIGKQVLKDTFSTCHNFDYVGTYDYNEHYIGFETLASIDEFAVNLEDGYYQISISNLDELACTNLRISVKDADNQVLEEVYKVPIMVKANTNTSDPIFDKKKCDECDVIVLAGKTLTVTETIENRDVKLYEGSKLSVPSGSEYSINSLSLRRNGDSVSTIELGGTLNVVEKVYFDLSITGDDWHYITLPDSFTVDNLKLPDGTTARYGYDYLAYYYDGEYRSIHKTGGWKRAPSTKKFAPGEGLIFAIADDKAKQEFRFELNTTILNDETAIEKSAGHMKAWGCNNNELAPNHKGWNLVGNPYMNNKETDIADDLIGIGTLKKDSVNGHWTGGWSMVEGGKLKYAVMPSTDPEDVAAGGYKSVVLDEVTLKPFTCFFVQLGGTDDESVQVLNFTSAHNVNSIVSRRTLEDEIEDKEVFLRIRIDKWKTGCFISDKFTDEYEPGDDLESGYPIYQDINGYKLLYSAINDSIIEHGITVHSPKGYLILDPKVNTTLFEYIYVNYNNEWYNLINCNGIDIEEGNFILQAKVKRKEIPTNIEQVMPTNGIYKITDGKHVYINRNDELYSVYGNRVR